MNNNTTKVYETIKHFREIRKMTRKQIASNLEISVSGYSKIERGEVDVTLSKLVKITEILDVELNNLLNFNINSVFDIGNNTLVSSDKTIINESQNNLYIEKYIKILEEENKILKKNL